MPGTNSQFNLDWLCIKDCNDVLISFWCKQKGALTAFCTLCNASIKTRILALNQYVKTKTQICLYKD